MLYFNRYSSFSLYNTFYGLINVSYNHLFQLYIDASVVWLKDGAVKSWMTLAGAYRTVLNDDVMCD